MFKKLKLKIAARRVERQKARKGASTRRRTTRKSANFWTRMWNIICWPLDMIARISRRVWAWVRSIDLIGLVNLTLLVAIIVLFSMLVIDIVGCNKKKICCYYCRCTGRSCYSGKATGHVDRRVCTRISKAAPCAAYQAQSGNT